MFKNGRRLLRRDTVRELGEVAVAGIGEGLPGGEGGRGLWVGAGQVPAAGVGSDVQVTAAKDGGVRLYQPLLQGCGQKERFQEGTRCTAQVLRFGGMHNGQGAAGLYVDCDGHRGCLLQGGGKAATVSGSPAPIPTGPDPLLGFLYGPQPPAPSELARGFHRKGQSSNNDGWPRSLS